MSNNEISIINLNKFNNNSIISYETEERRKFMGNEKEKELKKVSIQSQMKKLKKEELDKKEIEQLMKQKKEKQNYVEISKRIQERKGKE